MIGQRQGLIVWLKSLKKARQLKRYGNVHYVSKRLKYAVVYCDMKNRDRIIQKLESLSFVKKVELSYRPYLRTEFNDKTKEEMEELEYDYRIGL